MSAGNTFCILTSKTDHILIQRQLKIIRFFHDIQCNKWLLLKKKQKSFLNTIINPRGLSPAAAQSKAIAPACLVTLPLEVSHCRLKWEGKEVCVPCVYYFYAWQKRIQGQLALQRVIWLLSGETVLVCLAQKMAILLHKLYMGNLSKLN